MVGFGPSFGNEQSLEATMTENRPVLVVGGTGMLGGQVVTELLARGKQVRALVRVGSATAPLEAAGAAVARGDMMDPDSLIRAMDGVESVITTAAGYTRHRKGDTPETDTVGNANLVDAASAGGSQIRPDEHPHLRPDPWRSPLLAQEADRGPARGPGGALRGAAPRRVL
jgi:NAD(P)-dependent dehydrogenase (short-subunit alcohol dehydrogenase family)